MSNSKKIHKPTSRITLADLFGDGPLPTPAEIAEAAQTAKAEQQAKKQKATLRAKSKGLQPGQASTDHAARLEDIRRAAAALGQCPSWARSWHPTARLLVLEQQTCTTCHTVWQSPGAPTWLVRYTNSRTGATQAAPAGGPIDRRLPAERFIHQSTVGVCQNCAQLPDSECVSGLPTTYSSEPTL